MNFVCLQRAPPFFFFLPFFVYLMQRVAIVNCSHCRSNVSMERNDSMQNHLRDCAPFLSGPVYEFKQGDVPLSRSDQWAQSKPERGKKKKKKKSSCSPPVSELLQSNALVLNTPYFAVSSAWFESFLLYVQGFEGAEHPGCLDNSMLATVEADDRVVVRPNLDVDLFRFVHAQIWMRISAWYKGADNAGDYAQSCASEHRLCD
jgi:hypothetical protein